MLSDRVFARIEGGLGNQFFQYAAARSLADKLQCELMLDLRGIAENGDRPYQLDLYRARVEIAGPDQLALLPQWRSSRIGRLWQAMSFLLPAVFHAPVFLPHGFAYDARIEKLRRPVYMVGYWQTERYFAWNRNRLIQDLVLRADQDTNAVWLQKIDACNSVSLHVRRGDYINSSSAAQIHGTCDLGYYRRAIEDLMRREPNIEVFVFSDEPQWALSNLHLPVPMHVVDANPPEQGYLDIELMRRCRHHVLANSSFSWWGAWLCEYPGQIVFAPTQWFANPGFNTNDVVPARWHRLQSSG